MAKSYWHNKKVLVTGGAGFIGSYIVELLLNDGAKVSIIDDLSRGRLENLSNVLNEVTFFQNDMRNMEACRNAAAGKDIVLNLASPAFGIEYSSTHHGEMLTDVTLIGFNALRAAYLEGVKRFLVVSSSCVYSDDAKIPTPESEGTRSTPEQVNAGYGWGKRMVELQSQYYAQEYGMEIAIVRPFNAYGSREPFEINKANVMPSLICKVLRGDNPVVVWGSGNQTRSFIHGKDFAMGLKLITELYPAADPVNLGHDRETSIRELVEQILKITGRKTKLFFDTSKPEGAKRKSADVTKLKKVTGGFVPQITLDQGLKEMIEYIEKEIASSPNKI